MSSSDDDGLDELRKEIEKGEKIAANKKLERLKKEKEAEGGGRKFWINKEYKDLENSLNMEHSELLESEFPDQSWMLRKSQCYYDEYVNCKSWSLRLNQYFIDGEFKDCEKDLLENFKDCEKFEKDKDLSAAGRIIQREQKRIDERLKGHLENDVWERRTEPIPEEEWRKPLPSYIQKNVENSRIRYASNPEYLSDASVSYLISSSQTLSNCSIM